MEPDNTTMPTTRWADVIDEIGAIAADEADDAERECRLSDALYEKAIGLGLFDQFRDLAGRGSATPMEWFDHGVRLGWWDGSIAWVVTQGCLPLHAVRLDAPDLWPRVDDPELLPIAATNAGMLTATPLHDGRWRVDGQIGFNSGCDGARSFFGLVCIGDDPSDPEQLRFVWAPADRWEIVRDWDTTGLRGTGSHAVRANGMIVDESNFFPVFAVAETDDPLRCISVGVAGACIISASVAATQLGLARRALDEVQVLTREKHPPPTFQCLDDQPTVRRNLMELEGRWHQAYCGVRTGVERLWEAAHKSTPTLDARLRSLVMTSTSLANRDAASIAETAALIAGTTTLDASHPISRCLRDIRPLLAHVSANEAILEYAAAGWRREPTALPIV